MDIRLCPRCGEHPILEKSNGKMMISCKECRLTTFWQPNGYVEKSWNNVVEAELKTMRSDNAILQANYEIAIRNTYKSVIDWKQKEIDLTLMIISKLLDDCTYDYALRKAKGQAKQVIALLKSNDTKEDKL